MKSIRHWKPGNKTLKWIRRSGSQYRKTLEDSRNRKEKIKNQKETAEIEKDDK
jgi:hypothetical protein